MSLQNHLSALERRHEELEREIAKEQLHPGNDELHMAELKRRKLHLKDEIAKIRDSQTVH